MLASLAPTDENSITSCAKINIDTLAYVHQTHAILTRLDSLFTHANVCIFTSLGYVMDRACLIYEALLQNFQTFSKLTTYFVICIHRFI